MKSGAQNVGLGELRYASGKLRDGHAPLSRHQPHTTRDTWARRRTTELRVCVEYDAAQLL